MVPTSAKTIPGFHVAVPSTGDSVRDILRLRRVVGVMQSNPGEVPFYLWVKERKMVCLEFPFSVDPNDESVSAIAEIVGPNSILVSERSQI